MNALSFVLTASLATREGWANNNATCPSAVRDGAAEATAKTYNIKPAVVAATFGGHFLADSYSHSAGFPHVVSMHSASVVAAVEIRDNVANSSVFRIMDATANVYNTTLASNQLMGGNVLQGDSFKGHFDQVGSVTELTTQLAVTASVLASSHLRHSCSATIWVAPDADRR